MKMSLELYALKLREDLTIHFKTLRWLRFTEVTSCFCTTLNQGKERQITQDPKPVLIQEKANSYWLPIACTSREPGLKYIIYLLHLKKKLQIETTQREIKQQEHQMIHTPNLLGDFSQLPILSDMYVV